MDSLYSYYLIETKIEIANAGKKSNSLKPRFLDSGDSSLSKYGTDIGLPIIKGCT
ncbi:hypothetical protein GCM10025767_11450 [Thalassotalea piscium]